MAPEMPMAKYKFGAMAIPVCPTCSWCGRQLISATGLLQAVAAPNNFARSVTSAQFSGPFNPRPPLITISASVNGTSPSTLLVAVTCTFGASTVVENSATVATPSVVVIE